MQYSSIYIFPPRYGDPSHGGPTDLHPGMHESTASTSYPPRRRPRSIATQHNTSRSSRTTAHRQPPFAPINHRLQATVAFKYPDRRDRRTGRPRPSRTRAREHVRCCMPACVRPSTRGRGPVSGCFPATNKQLRICLLSAQCMIAIPQPRHHRQRQRSRRLCIDPVAVGHARLGPFPAGFSPL